MEPKTPPVDTGSTQPVTTPTPPAQPESPPVDTMEKGGKLSDKIGDFTLFNGITSLLLFCASVYSIFYHRQMLNKLND